ncbi:MAG: chorismate-binding protein [archaeon]|nr:chorismate-binding protein [archaeon]MDA1130972.1 chorismate-binding protein [archaeon]
MICPILNLRNSLNEAGLLGRNAVNYGSPDSLILLSGGPESHLAQHSFLCGPSSTRVVIKQPNRQKIAPQDAADALNGEFNLLLKKPQFIAEIEQWRHGCWYHADSIFSDGLDDLFVKLRLHSNKDSFVSNSISSNQKLPQRPFWAGGLAYDMLQWTQPIALQNPPKEDALLAVLWLIDKVIIHDKNTEEIDVFSLEGDDWSIKANKLLSKFENKPFLPAELPSGVIEEISSHSDQEHENVVNRIQDSIRSGQVYQVNFGRRWSGELLCHPSDVFERLSVENPAPFSAYLEAEDLGFALASSSPETLLRCDDEVINTAPIKGTCSRGEGSEEEELLRNEMLVDEKERSEHRMLVDLMRNDLSKVCSVDSVKVERFDVEVYANVQHLVSHIKGSILPNMSGIDAIQSIFPGGSITGCPKTVVCAVIDQLEEKSRSFWTGSVGWIDVFSGSSSWNILIRTLEAHRIGKTWSGTIVAGGGITIASNPAAEVSEAKWKAEALRKACGWIPTSQKTGQSTQLSIHPQIAENSDTSGNGKLGKVFQFKEMRNLLHDDSSITTCGVLLIDNLDSFTYNIAHNIAILGHDVTVLRGRGAIADAFSDPTTLFDLLGLLNPTHLILGPGPGNPSNSELTMALSRHALAGQLNVPLLGICLGHQALAEAGGMNIIRAPLGPVHGTPWPCHHNSSGIFAGIESPTNFTRYHSLVVEGEKPNSQLVISATDQSKSIIMALQHTTLPICSVQFHPESVGSEHGNILLTNFLRMCADA